MDTYLTQLNQWLEHYNLDPFVVETDLQIRPNTDKQVYLTGHVIFQGSSKLYFREYLDILDQTIDKLMYSYHYQATDNNLIFRYDNANHKPPLGFIEHKHLMDGCIIPASAPTLAEVLLEIALWLQKNVIASRTGLPEKRDKDITGLPEKRDKDITGLPEKRDKDITGLPEKRDKDITGLPEKTDKDITGLPEKTDRNRIGGVQIFRFDSNKSKDLDSQVVPQLT